ncbi:MAG: hypothetical protein Q8N81_02600, partial [bacterium]|nr:hypothetical protein [bacterium]
MYELASRMSKGKKAGKVIDKSHGLLALIRKYHHALRQLADENYIKTASQEEIAGLFSLDPENLNLSERLFQAALPYAIDARRRGIGLFIAVPPNPTLSAGVNLTSFDRAFGELLSAVFKGIDEKQSGGLVVVELNENNSLSISHYGLPGAHTLAAARKNLTSIGWELIEKKGSLTIRPKEGDIRKDRLDYFNHFPYSLLAREMPQNGSIALEVGRHAFVNLAVEALEGSEEAKDAILRLRLGKTKWAGLAEAFFDDYELLKRIYATDKIDDIVWYASNYSKGVYRRLSSMWFGDTGNVEPVENFSRNLVHGSAAVLRQILEEKFQDAPSEKFAELIQTLRRNMIYWRIFANIKGITDRRQNFSVLIYNTHFEPASLRAEDY